MLLAFAFLAAAAPEANAKPPPPTTKLQFRWPEELVCEVEHVLHIQSNRPPAENLRQSYQSRIDSEMTYQPPIDGFSHFKMHTERTETFRCRPPQR